MVNAFVISPKLEDLVIKQAAILRAKSSEKSVQTTTDTTNIENLKLGDTLKYATDQMILLGFLSHFPS